MTTRVELNVRFAYDKLDDLPRNLSRGTIKLLSDLFPNMTIARYNVDNAENIVWTNTDDLRSTRFFEPVMPGDTWLISATLNCDLKRSWVGLVDSTTEPIVSRNLTGEDLVKCLNTVTSVLHLEIQPLWSPGNEGVFPSVVFFIQDTEGKKYRCLYIFHTNTLSVRGKDLTFSYHIGSGEKLEDAFSQKLFQIINEPLTISIYGTTININILADSPIIISILEPQSLDLDHIVVQIGLAGDPERRPSVTLPEGTTLRTITDAILYQRLREYLLEIGIENFQVLYGLRHIEPTSNTTTFETLAMAFTG
jgi:hypothetical protein